MSETEIQPGSIEAVTHQRDLLAVAVGDLLQAYGMIRTDEPVALTGPMLLYQAELAAEHMRNERREKSENENTPLDTKITDVCSQIKFGLTLAPDGDFSFRIKRLIDELPKVDMIASLGPNYDLKLFTNNPDRVGFVLGLKQSDDPAYAIPDVIVPVTVTGNFEEWLTEVAKPNFNAKTFLEKFILNHHDPSKEGIF